MWTSASVIKSIGDAFLMDFSFNSPTMSYTLKESNVSFNVVCVRGDILPKSQFVVRNFPETVTDTASGLMWQRRTVDWKTWKDALEYCENSDYAGFTDWRVPNINEAFTLTDYTRTSGMATNFPDMPDVDLWTSNTASKDSTEAYSVSFTYGIGAYSNKADYHSVLCVR